MRMRADALHTLNVAREPRCSLYVQPNTQPPGRARCCSPQSQAFSDSRAEGSEHVPMTWRATFAKALYCSPRHRIPLISRKKGSIDYR